MAASFGYSDMCTRNNLFNAKIRCKIRGLRLHFFVTQALCLQRSLSLSLRPQSRLSTQLVLLSFNRLVWDQVSWFWHNLDHFCLVFITFFKQALLSSLRNCQNECNFTSKTDPARIFFIERRRNDISSSARLNPWKSQYNIDWRQRCNERGQS